MIDNDEFKKIGSHQPIKPRIKLLPILLKLFNNNFVLISLPDVPLCIIIYCTLHLSPFITAPYQFLPFGAK